MWQIPSKQASRLQQRLPVFFVMEDTAINQKVLPEALYRKPKQAVKKDKS